MLKQRYYPYAGVAAIEKLVKDSEHMARDCDMLADENEASPIVQKHFLQQAQIYRAQQKAYAHALELL